MATSYSEFRKLNVPITTAGEAAVETIAAYNLPVISVWRAQRGPV